MPDRESVITHLQIIHTWAEFARERDLQFFTPKHLEDIAQWSADALVMIEEQKQMYFTLEHDWRMLRELLKEHEAVVPYQFEDIWKCGNCGDGVVAYDELGVSGIESVRFNYCPTCGRSVKWE